MKKLFNLANIGFLLLLLLEIIPSRRNDTGPFFLLVLVVSIQVLYLLILAVSGDDDKRTAAGDITAIIYALIFSWELFTTKLDILDQMLFPAPGIIVSLFITDLPVLLKGFADSMELLLAGYLLALAFAIPLALVIGWRKRLYNAVNPLTKVLGPIPPIVYIPYAIGLLPTFMISSIFIIFVGAFWPIFINTLNGVFNIEKRIIDSAKALNVSEKTMLFEIILPGALPAIISGSTIGLVLAFILLTAAEMIGATSGLGWYVKYFSDFADYSRVIVGIIFIGMVVTAITYVFNKIEVYLLRWRN
ncbi:MAG: ABC transporter permease [Firmicutes bacterium HGW-Firmicutes-14]|nr:MAG: ABC transporter permease [Firmicutes bacterium HGW-Firmicutes-14]